MASQVKHSFSIRRFHSDDRIALKQCFIQLQEHEREIVSHRLPGEAIADRYMESLIQKVRQGKAEIFVAVYENKPAGFVSVLLSEKLDEELNENIDVAYISDIVVNQELRRMGIAQALIKRAEEFAIAHGATYLSAHVLAGNSTGRALYAKAGFDEYELFLLKPLTGADKES
ncbi:MAG TPA: GNAT family N-acetyltransferase [Candidatus Obscuribacterales bacterium]